MKKILYLLALVLSILMVQTPAAAKDEYTKGKVFTVKCKHDASQSYACYLPKGYKSSKKFNILYCFAPDARGSYYAKLYKAAAEKHDWIVVGSNNARNGPGGPIQAAANAIWKDTHARFSLKENGCYSSGFSGGSGMALRMALSRSKNFLGVITLAVASSWAENMPDIPKHISICMIIGSTDAVQYVRKHEKSLKAKSNTAKVIVFEGAHTPPPATVAKEAVDWMVKMEKGKKPAILMAEAEAFLKEKRVYEARERFSEIAKKHPKSDEAEKAKKKVTEIDEDKTLAEELLAGKLYSKGDEQEKKGKKDKALKYYKQVVKKYPKTNYAKLAKPKVDELGSEVLYEKALKLEKKGEIASAQKYFKQVIEKFPDSDAAKKAREKVEKE